MEGKKFLMILNGIFPKWKTRKRTYKYFWSHIDKDSDRKQFTILTSEKILQRLLTALAQVKASNTSEKLLN